MLATTRQLKKRITFQSQVRESAGPGWNVPHTSASYGCSDCFSYSVEDLCSHEIRWEALTSVSRLRSIDTFALITMANSSSSAAPPERSSLILKGSALKLETALSGTLYYFRLGQKIELVRWEGRAVMSRLCSKANRFRAGFLAVSQPFGIKVEWNFTHLLIIAIL